MVHFSQNFGNVVVAVVVVVAVAVAVAVVAGTEKDAMVWFGTSLLQISPINKDQ